MWNRRITGVLLVWLLLPVGGCDSTIDNLFGRAVPVDKGDLTAPSVRILIADIYVKQPVSGDFSLETGQRFAQVEPYINIAVVAHDPEGVQSIELSDIVIEPFCKAPPSGGLSRADKAVVPVTVPGERIAVPESSEVATTRMTLIKPLHIADGAGRISSLCPQDRPRLDNAVVRLTARAVNFGGKSSSTGTAVLSLKQISTSKGLARNDRENAEGGPGGSG